MLDDLKWKAEEWWNGTTKKTKIIIAVMDNKAGLIVFFISCGFIIILF